MNKPIPAIVLMVLGVPLVILGGGPNTNIGIVGIILFVVGILTVFFPKHFEKFNMVKSRENYVALISLGVILVAALVYIWWKLNS